MMAAARTPFQSDGSALHREVADLWAKKRDSYDIAKTLAAQGYRNHHGKPVTEADVYRILSWQQTWRQVGKKEGQGDA
ncbi:hypothetical protein HCU64_06660 [Methylobacterium sp. C25]|uniref:hypothetical protein n=1 Tax=Methylobacterium sp. C25 TaxID=2721622 RepID=UPI001F1EA2A7|nr:hypothetical protein [Methylobacterium sp. C25]MCE4223427.1 hypothetical protein [Methylobacterium sp. C25]